MKSENAKLTMPANKYVLITPTRNEEKYISETIASVIRQKVKPIQWIIVNDGSTDSTSEIINNAVQQNPWMKMVLRKDQHPHNFSAIVENYELGLRYLTFDDYDFIGLLDSDVSFDPDYFFKLMVRFQSDPQLGLAGGIVFDAGTEPVPPLNLNDVPGAVQFFRRDCFQAIGGIIPVPEGGWDMLTCAQARMAGYKTRLFTDLKVKHLKPRNISQGSLFKRFFQMGVRDYALGYHFLFELIKCLIRLKHYPFIIGSICWWSGYCHALVSRKKRIIPADLLEFIRKEQLSRLRLSHPGSHIFNSKSQ